MDLELTTVIQVAASLDVNPGDDLELETVAQVSAPAETTVLTELEAG